MPMTRAEVRRFGSCRRQRRERRVCRHGPAAGFAPYSLAPGMVARLERLTAHELGLHRAHHALGGGIVVMGVAGFRCVPWLRDRTKGKKQEVSPSISPAPQAWRWSRAGRVPVGRGLQPANAERPRSGRGRDSVPGRSNPAASGQSPESSSDRPERPRRVPSRNRESSPTLADRSG